MRRLLLILIAIPLLLIIAAAILVPLLLDKEKVVAMASEELEKQTGALLKVDGDIGLSIFPNIGVSLAQTSLTMPEDHGAEVSVRSLEIGLQLMPLLSGELAIDSINLDGLIAKITSQSEDKPEVDTSGLSDEELEALYAARRKAMSEAGEAAGGTNVLAAPLAMNVGKLSVTNSQLEMLDAKSGEKTIITLKKLLAQNLNLDGNPIPLELEFTLEGEQPLDLDFDGNIKVDQHSQSVNLDQTTLSVNGLMANTVVLQLDGPVDIANQVADLKLAVELGDTRGDGSLRYASFESPQIDTRMHLNLFNPALVVLAGPEAAEKAGEAAPPEQTAGASTDSGSGDTPLPLDALRSIDTRANLKIDKAVFDAHTVQDLQVNLRASEGAIKITRFTGKVHGGELDMKASFNARHNTAKLSANGGLKGLDIPTALVAVESEPVVTGTASLTWTLKSSGRTANELIEAMNGPLKLTTDQVVLKGMGIEKMFCQVVALANQQGLTAEFPADSAVKDLSADIQLNDGKAKLNPLKVDLEGISLRGKGRLELLSQDFKADFDARITPALGELDPACKVNERYTSIDWPVDCEGNVSGEPGDWCMVDSGEILEQLAKKEATRKVQKEAGKLLDKLFK